MSGPACADGCARSDLLGSRLRWLVWGVPAVLFSLGIGWEAMRAWLWVPSLAVAGSACLVNAQRCGRLHCKLTGPAFALAAVATLLDALGVIAVSWLGTLAVVVSVGLVGFSLECLQGKYAGTRPTAHEGQQ